MYLSSNFHRAVKFCICLQVFICSKIFHFHDFSTVAQKCHGNFNLTLGNFNLLTAISIQFHSRQFQYNLTHGNANLLTATLTAFFASLTTCQLRRPTGTNSDRYEFISVSIHFFSGMRLHGTGLKMNSDRSDFISVADPTRVTFVRD